LNCDEVINPLGPMLIQSTLNNQNALQPPNTNNRSKHQSKQRKANGPTDTEWYITAIYKQIKTASPGTKGKGENEYDALYMVR